MKHHFGEFIESNPQKKKEKLNDADAADANDDDVVIKICLEFGFVKEFNREVLDSAHSLRRALSTMEAWEKMLNNKKT